MSGGHILSGHQPSFFHAGILAKRTALDRSSLESDTGADWLVVDQDVNDPGVIPFPDLDERGLLVRRHWRAFDGEAGVPTCLRRWRGVTPPPRTSDRLPDSVGAGLDRMHRALEESEGDTVADRIAAANERLASELIGRHCRLLRASDLLDTEVGRTFLERIRAEPVACARVWNESVALVPRSARGLRIDVGRPARTEVPVWCVDPETGRRRTATAGDLADGRARLLPKAFLMTAIARSEGIRLMIHGTGGGAYERVTESWAREFLGIDLAPVTVVTATVRLPLDDLAPTLETAVTPRELRRLEHDPWSDSEEKRALVARIDAAPRGSGERLQRYRALHEARARQCERVAERLSALRGAIRESGVGAAALEVAQDRTWPWPLHDPERLRRELATADQAEHR